MTNPPPKGRGRARVAVLLPVYNDQPGLDRSLESLRHDGAAFDVVVVDDGSEPPVRVPGDARDLPFAVTLLRLPQNRGITGALNAGLECIEAAGYAYVARLDAGDLSLPGRLAAQTAFLDRHPEHAVVGTQTEYVDPSGRLLFHSRRPLTHPDIVRTQCYHTGLGHPSVMMRMDMLRDVGYYSSEYRGCEDYELFVRLSKHYKLANMSAIYLRYEIKPGSLSSRTFVPGLYRLRVMLRYFAPWSPHSYLGVARNIMALFVPRRLSVFVRRTGARWRGVRRMPYRMVRSGTDRLASGREGGSGE